MRSLKRQFLTSVVFAALGLMIATLGAMMVEDSRSLPLYRVGGVGVIMFGMLGLIVWGMVSFVRLRDIQTETRLRNR